MAFGPPEVNFELMSRGCWTFGRAESSCGSTGSNVPIGVAFFLGGTEASQMIYLFRDDSSLSGCLICVMALGKLLIAEWRPRHVAGLFFISNLLKPSNGSSWD